LYDYDSYIGFLRIAGGLDPLAPGNPRDTWGVSANDLSAWADQAYWGGSGVFSTSSFGSNTASFDTTTYSGLDLEVMQTYAFATPNILRISTTVKNVGSSTASSVLFQRDVDWDFPPYSDTSFGPPIFGNVVDSSYNGFELPDPMVPFLCSCAGGCSETGDWGGGIKLGLGDLAPGESTSFAYLYGVNYIGQTPAGLISEAQALGAYYYIATYSSDGDLNSATNSALIGVAATAIPEPGTGAILLIGAGMIAAGFRRRRAR
jgi:hypothetical protein